MVRWPALLIASACSSVPAKTIFGPPVEIAVGSFPIDVAVADLDGDGFLDLVSADARARALSVLRGRGDGTFAAGGVLPLGAEPHLVVAGDLDADGDVDLVASAHDDPGVHVWLGDGQGGFEPRPPAAAHEGARGHNHGLALGDIDGDGRLDAVTANQDLGSISVLLGDGLGLAPGSPVAVGAGPYGCALGDLDGDGRLDIVVPLVHDGAVAVVRGDRRSPDRYPTLPRPYAVAIVDLDLDGRPDVLAAHDDSDDVTLLLGRDDGRLAPAPWSPFTLGGRVFRMEAGDLDGDGRIDLVAGAGDRLLLLMGATRRAQLAPTGQSWSVALGDLDRDGAIDVIAPDARADRLRLWLSR